SRGLRPKPNRANRGFRRTSPAPVVTDESAPDRITLARQRLFSDAGVLCHGRNHHHGLLAGIDEDHGKPRPTSQRKPAVQLGKLVVSSTARTCIAASAWRSW